jgi:hypothetical protein
MQANKEITWRLYTFSGFLKDLIFLISRTPKIIILWFQKRVSKTFEEKIMLVVTSINGCSYCSWYQEREAKKFYSF